MAYLEVNLDSFIKFEKYFRIKLSNIYNIVGLLEVNNIHGICFSYDVVDDIELFLDTVKSMTEARINVRVVPEKGIIQRLLQYKPDVITLIDPSSDDLSVFLPSKKIKEVTSEFSNREEIGFVIRLQPDLKFLKFAYQYGCDEIELASDSLALEEMHIEYNKKLEQIAHSARVAKKNGMRVSISGGLNRRVIDSLINIVDFEFISLDDILLAEAIFKGLSEVLKEYIILVEGK